MKPTGVIVLCLCFVPAVVCATSFDLGLHNDSEYYARYLELDKELLKFADQGVKAVLPYVLESSEGLNVSSQCMRNGFTLIRGIRKLKMWALQFLDANPKPPDGALRGSALMLGDFDECVSITVPKRDGSVDFRGQHCVVSYAPFLPKVDGYVNMDDGIKDFRKAVENGSDAIRFVAEMAHLATVDKGRIGICVPSGCTENDIQNIVQHLGPKVMLDTAVEYCQLENGIHLNGIQIFFICGSSFFVSLGIFASFLEYHLNRKDIQKRSMLTKSVLCFSLTSNFQKIMDSPTNLSSLSCLHGIRVLTLLYIILAHRYFAIMVLPTTRNLLYMRDFTQRFFSQIITNTFLCIEVFMFMGGFLHSYLKISFLGDKAAIKSPGYVKIFVLRLYRLAPIYIVAVLLLFVMVPRGPIAPLHAQKVLSVCEKNWWWNVLFINNFFNIEEVCLPQSWYLSADTQIFLLSLLPISLLMQRKKAGVWLCTALAAGGIIITVIWCYVIGAPPTTVFFTPSRELFIRYQSVYTLPFPHLAPYFIGVLLGYYLAKEKEVVIPKKYQVIGWPTAFLLSASMIFMVWKWNNGSPYTAIESALYFSISRFVYSLGIAWMVLCCVNGQGGIINYILSMKMWVPLSRLSYATYLVSLSLQIFYRLNSRYLDDIHEMHVIWRYMGDVVVSFLMSFALVIIFESPAIALQKLWFPLDVSTEKAEDKPVQNGVENGGFKHNEISAFELEKNEKNIIA